MPSCPSQRKRRKNARRRSSRGLYRAASSPRVARPFRGPPSGAPLSGDPPSAVADRPPTVRLPRDLRAAAPPEMGAAAGTLSAASDAQGEAFVKKLRVELPKVQGGGEKSAALAPALLAAAFDGSPPPDDAGEQTALVAKFLETDDGAASDLDLWKALKAAVAPASPSKGGAATEVREQASESERARARRGEGRSPSAASRVSRRSLQEISFVSTDGRNPRTSDDQNPTASCPGGPSLAEERQNRTAPASFRRRPRRRPPPRHHRRQQHVCASFSLAHNDCSPPPPLCAVDRQTPPLLVGALLLFSLLPPSARRPPSPPSAGTHTGPRSYPRATRRTRTIPSTLCRASRAGEGSPRRTRSKTRWAFSSMTRQRRRRTRESS